MNHLTAAVLLLFVFEIIKANELNEPYVNKKMIKAFNDETFQKFTGGIKFTLWPRSSQFSHRVYLGQESLLQRHWVQNKPLKIYVHGFGASDEKDFEIRQGFLGSVNEYNVITVEWSKIKFNYNYIKVVNYSWKIGMAVGNLMYNLVKNNLTNADLIEAVGFSVGAHILGLGGRTFFKATKTKIARITAIDPPALGFYYAGLKYNCLEKKDAKFVDVIHTSMGKIGIIFPIGHADFYVNNGGPFQPFCERKDIKKSNPRFALYFCSHNVSLKYYEESILFKNSFESVRCSSRFAFNSGKCKNNTRSNMGHDADPKKHGSFYLKTKDLSPFSIPLPQPDLL